MNLREEILKKHSKEQCLKIVDRVGSSQKKFDELFHLFLKDEYRVTQRAARPLSYAVQAHPCFMDGHVVSLLANLKKKDLHNAVKRNSVRLLQYLDIPPKLHGELMNICFDFLASPTEPVAVKAFSMSVLGKLVKDYPDILPEIKILINDQLPQQTPAFKSRAKKLLGKNL